MSEFDRIISHIIQKKNNPDTWIPVPYNRLSDHIGITKKMYHLIGGDSGTGKTSWVDNTYIMGANNWIYHSDTDTKLKTIYFSMERSKEYKKTKWLAHRLYTHNNILVDVPTLLNWGNGGTLTDDIIEISKTHKEYFNQLYEDVDIKDGIVNPTGIYMDTYRFCLNHGTVYKRTYQEDNSPSTYYKKTLSSWENHKNKVTDTPWIKIEKNQCPVLLSEGTSEYVQHDDNLILQGILDHNAKPSSEKGLYSKKDIIDKTSEYITTFRDFFGMCFVSISQFNRSNNNVQRRIHSDLTPEESDFKNSSNPYEDADVVLGLFNPYKHNMSQYDGYNIKKTIVNKKARYRSLSLLKNSYGTDNMTGGLLFLGENGFYKEIPIADNINYNQIFNV